MDHFVLKDLDAQKPIDGVEVRALSGERMTMALFTLEPRVEIPHHTHPHEQMGTVLKGTLVIVFEGEEILVKAGEIYLIPPNVDHGGRTLDSPAEILESFSSVREDLALPSGLKPHGQTRGTT